MVAGQVERESSNGAPNGAGRHGLRAVRGTVGGNGPGRETAQGFRRARVMEIKVRHDTNAYRTVYTAQFGSAVASGARGAEGMP
jgi:hypothetical protein